MAENNPATYGADVDHANHVDKRLNVGGFYNETTWQDREGNTFVVTGEGAGIANEKTYDKDANEYELLGSDGLYSWQTGGPAAREGKPAIERFAGTEVSYDEIPPADPDNATPATP